MRKGGQYTGLLFVWGLYPKGRMGCKTCTEWREIVNFDEFWKDCTSSEKDLFQKSCRSTFKVNLYCA